MITTRIIDSLGAVVTIETSIFNRFGPAADNPSPQKSIIEAIRNPTGLIQVSDPELTRYYFKKVDADYAVVIGVLINKICGKQQSSLKTQRKVLC